MFFIILGVVIITVCIIIYKRMDMSILMRKDYIKPILLSIFAFAGCLLIISPFVQYGIESSKLKRETSYLQNEIKTENARRGDISESLVYDVTQHNDKANEFVNGYNLWFGTPMFKHKADKYIVSVDGYTVWYMDNSPTNDETIIDEIVTDEETTVEDDILVIGGQRYKLRYKLIAVN